MKKNMIVLGLLIYFSPIAAQIYYKEIVYIFNYTIEKENKSTQKGIIYLGCLGKPWPLEKELGRQAGVIWTTDKDYLVERRFTTGIYEEKNLIWLHPPRENEFSMLEYSPFPYIYFPVSDNISWKRNFIPGENWVNEEFNIKSSDVLKFNYINTGIVSHSYKEKKLECWKIEAELVNRKEQTTFSGLFNMEYGFVKMKFQNLDKSMITFELCDMRSFESFQKIKVHSSFLSK